MSEDYLNKVIALVDGKMGTIIEDCDDNGQWGVKVEGESRIRKISNEEIKNLGGGSLIQIPVGPSSTSS
ncbi:MAG: hypothetical protein SVZ03_00600 [Spirochaetota bacterium]|nr:hypothetical protein [Spirochaetota bacterium]